MSAHQPNFLPYLGFFDKMMNSDVFVIRDEVDFVERDYHHRNRIRIDGKDANGEPQWKWLTIPVKKDPFYIKDIVIIWPDFDPMAKEVHLFITGLSNETAVVYQPAIKDDTGKPKEFFLRKTLELNYKVGGDPIYRGDTKLTFESKRWIMR